MRNIQLWLVVVLLVLMAGMQGYQIYSGYQAANDCSKALKLEEEKMKLAGLSYESLVSDYEEGAYHSVQIDRISEQQLLAAEFQLRALQIMNYQNSSLLNIIVACK